MGQADWDIAGFTDALSRIRKTVRAGEVRVPAQIDLSDDGSHIVWDYSDPRAKKADTKWVNPKPELLNQFALLWQRSPGAIVQFARKWGVLYLDEQGRPCRPTGICPRNEPIAAWRHFSRRAYAVLNIAASLAQNRVGAEEDWKALPPVRIKEFGSELAQRWFGFRVWAEHGGTEYISRSGRSPRQLEVERSFLFAETTLWLKLGGVGFILMPEDHGWQLSIDYNGFLLAAVAVQLALTLADIDNLYTCSGCGVPYVRRKKSPKPGQANFCEQCEKNNEPLRQADRRRRQKVQEACRLYSEGVPVTEIAAKLDTKPKHVKNWIKRRGGKNGETRTR